MGTLGTELLSGQPTQPRQRICDLAVGSTQPALVVANSRHDFIVFWNAATAIHNTIPCTEKGIQDGIWFTLRGGCDSFGVCLGCFAGIIDPLGLSPFFERQARGATGEVRLCDFCPAQPRCGPLLLRLAQAVQVGVFAPFDSYASRLSGIPPCQRSTFLSNAVWYGYADCCQVVVAGSSLDSSLPMHSVQDPRATMCCLYGARMQQVWREACAAGSPEGFLAAARRRMEVYRSTVPVVEAFEQRKLLRTRQALYQGVPRLRYKGIEGLRELSGATGGNSYATWKPTNSAELLNGMRAGLASANRTEEAAQIARLRAQWAAVE